MYTEPVDFLVAVFSQAAGASKMLEGLKETAQEQWEAIKDKAVLYKDANGKFHVNEDKDMTGGAGAAIGGVVGALIGALTGPGAIVLGAAGAMIGGLASKLHDSGFDNKDLQALAQSLNPSTSALMLVVEEKEADSVAQVLRAAGAQVIRDALYPSVADELDAEQRAFVEKLKEVGQDGLTVDSGQLLGERAAEEGRMQNEDASGVRTNMPKV